MKVTIRIRNDEPGQEYIAWCPALPGCSARGKSEEEAKLKIEQAIHGYLASLDVAPRDLQPHLVMA